jgi:hypothetical protein
MASDVIGTENSTFLREAEDSEVRLAEIFLGRFFLKTEC